MKTPRYLRARHSLPVESPDILHNGHRYRHVPFLPERRPAATGRIKTDWQLGNIQAAAPMPLTSPGNDDDTGENHQPTLRKNTAEPVEQTLKQNSAGRGRRPRGPPPFGMTAPAARKGTPPASAPACAAAAASSSSTGRPGISTAGRPCRSARSSSSHARTRGISSLCWMAFSRHPAHHRGRIIFHATKMTGRHACSHKAGPRL